MQVLKEHLPPKLFAVLQSASSCLMVTHWTDEEKMAPEAATAWLNASCDGAEGLVRKFRSQLRCEAACSGCRADKACDAHMCCSSAQLLILHGWWLELPSHGHPTPKSAAVCLACMQRRMEGSRMRPVGYTNDLVNAAQSLCIYGSMATRTGSLEQLSCPGSRIRPSPAGNRDPCI